MTVEHLMLLVALSAGAAGLYFGITWLLWVGAGVALLFVVAWIQYELRPHDPWRKFRKHRVDE